VNSWTGRNYESEAGMLTPLHRRLTAEKARESASTRSDRTPVFD
jgi:hypothetical protein